MRIKYLYRVIILVILAAVFFILTNSSFDLWTVRRNLAPVRYQSEIRKYADKFALDEELLTALIYVESRFDQYSESPRGAVGLMQLMPSTANWIADQLGHSNFKLDDLDDPELNIKFGSWYFAYLYQKFDKDLIITIAAYNAGENNVRKWINNGWEGDMQQELPFLETDNFVRRVLSTREYYKQNDI